MALESGQQVELAIEKPAAGGRMIARHGGQVVLVQGGIPGERVLARIERVERQLAFAATTEVLEPSPDRVEPLADAACGGCLYSHVSYARQRSLKGEVIQDAFVRLGRLPIEAPAVAPSPDRAYRMRARLHVRNARIGFYREGTHDLCDAAATGQLSEAAVTAATRAVQSLVNDGLTLMAIELTENLPANERVVHVVPAGEQDVTIEQLEAALNAGALTGCSGRAAGGPLRVSGMPMVSDSLSALTGGRAATGSLQRHAESFFQANRFLLPDLVQSVLDAVPADRTVLDLYAGVGLFAVALAATGREGITAVEGDRSSGNDLTANAVRQGGAIAVWNQSVEEFLRRRRRTPGTIIVDPPRTGLSRDAALAIARAGADRLLYVSCDPPTMARDARRLVDAGYQLTSLRAFDLFPNTPHVESLGIFNKPA